MMLRARVREFLRTDGLAVLALLAAVAYRFHLLFLHGRRLSLLNDEMADEYYPLASSIFARLRQGELPLWSPEILFGYPVALTVDLHTFSPFSWPFLLWPARVAIAAQMMTIQLASVFFMYALARSLPLGAAGAATAAILWASGCPSDNLLVDSMGLATVPWIPLVLLAWVRYARGGDPRWGIVTGGVLGLALLGGHVQFVYWTVIFLAGYLLVVERPLGKWWRDARRAIAGALVASAVAGALAGAMALPMSDLLDDSIRARLTPEQRVHTGTRSLEETWRALRWTVFCGQEHNEVEGNVENRSAGMLPVALALLAWGRGRRFDNRLLLLGLVFLVLSLGAVFAPSHWIVTHLPLNHFRYPSRIAIFFTLAAVLLAGRGMDRLLAGEARRLPNLVALGALAALCAPGLLALLAGDDVKVSEARRSIAALALPAVGLALPPSPRHWRLLRRLLAFLAVTWFVVHSQRITSHVVPAVVVQAHGRAAGAWSLLRDDEGRYPPGYLRWLPRRDVHGPTRVLYIDVPWEHDLTLLTGHHSPMGLVSLRPGRVDRLLYAREVASDEEEPLALTLAPKQHLLDLFNVRHIVIEADLYERHFSPTQRERSLRLGPSTRWWRTAPGCPGPSSSATPGWCAPSGRRGRTSRTRASTPAGRWCSRWSRCALPRAFAAGRSSDRPGSPRTRTRGWRSRSTLREPDGWSCSTAGRRAGPRAATAAWCASTARTTCSGPSG
jgi:hypothetical protein